MVWGACHKYLPYHVSPHFWQTFLLFRDSETTETCERVRKLPPSTSHVSDALARSTRVTTPNETKGLLVIYTFCDRYILILYIGNAVSGQNGQMDDHCS